MIMAVSGANIDKGPGTTLRRAIATVFTGAAFIVPLVIAPGLADSYTLPKVALLRLATYLVLVLWSARLAVGRRIAWVKTPLDWPVAAFMAAAVLAAAGSTNRALSFFGHYKRYEDVFTLVGYGLLYFAATNNLKRKDVLRVVSAGLAAAGLISVYAVCQYFGYDPVLTSAPAGRATGTLGNAVFLGTFLALMLPIALGRSAGRQAPLSRRLYMFLTVVMAAGLVATFSRGAWAGAAAGMAVLAVMSRRGISRGPAENALGRSKSGEAAQSPGCKADEARGEENAADGVFGRLSRRTVIAGMVAVAMVFAFANVYRHPDVKGRAPVFARAVSSFDTDNGSVATRLWLWRTTLGLIGRRPVLGYGPDTLFMVYPAHLPDAYKKIEPLARIDKAHNDTLNTGATLGLAGLAAFAAIVLVFFRASWARLRARVSGEGPILVAGLIAYLTAVQFSFSQVEVAAFFWLFLALATLSLGLAEPARLLGPDSPVGRALQWLAVAGIAGMSLAVFTVFTARPIVADYHFQQGLRAEARGRPERAQREFALAAAGSEARSLYYYRLGRSCQIDAIERKGGDTALLRTALAAYVKAEALDSTDPNLYTALGSLYTYLSRRDPRFADLAARAYSRSLALNRYLPETYVDLGVFEAQQGRRGAAIANFRRALRLEPTNRTAKENLRALSL